MADFIAIRQEECRAVPLPEGCRPGESRTLVLQSVLNGIKEHGRSSMHAEVCGVLVGSLCWDGGAYLLVDGRIEGKYASRQSGSVTFTSETWTFIHEELAAKHPDRIIVGWYHTHPGFGIFLSNMDAFIHENFFSFPWQPAYVFDPQAETDGFFFRTGNNLVREDVCIVPDAEPSVKAPVRGNAGGKVALWDEIGRKNRRAGVLLAVALGLVAGALALSAALLLRQSREKERMAENRAARLQETLREQKAEHRKAQEEWMLKRRTYEREIGRLHVTVTEITAERQGMEKENAGHKEAIGRLEAEHSRQAEDIRRLESELQASRETERLKASELEDAQKRVQQLQRDWEAAKASAEAPVRSDGEEPESHWYDWMKFWQRF